MCAPAVARRNSIFSPTRIVRVQHYGLDHWRLTIATNTFSGDVRCRLKRVDGRVIYRDRALGFRFDTNADTLRAWLKIDDAPAIRWRDMLPALAAQRTAIGGRNLDGPTDGIVWLPLAALDRARTVQIQIRANARPKSFAMMRFSELLGAAQRVGCASDERFYL